MAEAIVRALENGIAGIVNEAAKEHVEPVGWRERI